MKTWDQGSKVHPGRMPGKHPRQSVCGGCPCPIKTGLSRGLGGTQPQTLWEPLAHPRPPIYHQCNANGAGETPPPAGLGAWMHAPKKQRKEEGLGQKEKKEKLGEKREKTVAGAANRCPEPMPRGEHSPLQGDSGADIPQEPEGLQGLVSARVTLAPVSHSVNEGPGQADPQVTPQKSRCF